MRPRAVINLLVGLLSTSSVQSLEVLVSQAQASEPCAEYVIVDKSDQRLYVINDEQKVIESYRISSGRNRGDKRESGDCRTPEGDFILRTPVDSSQWLYEGTPHVYGPYFFRVEGSGWGSIGLHGTSGRVGVPLSHGCIRMRTKDLLEFKEEYYSDDMRVIIRE